jgi:glycosyltransferase involved in cell wall biosynthesis
LAEVAASSDILFVPDIFQDDRTKTLATVNRWFPGRRVAIFYDAIPLRLPEVTKALEQRTFPEYVRALASFDKVVCISRETEADLRHYWSKFGVAGGQTSVQLLPIDFNQQRNIVPPNGQAQRILCVSSFHLRKNHLRLFQAAELLWNEGLPFELILVGRTTAHGGPTVSAEIDRLTHKGRALHWQRHVDDASLHEEYRRCSFTVYPSVREGFGLPLLESLWHCRPCLCGSNGALGEVADGGGCLLINQEDVGSIANGMRQLLQDRETYRRLYEEARQRRFRSLDNYADELLVELQSKSRMNLPMALHPMTIPVATSAG